MGDRIDPNRVDEIKAELAEAERALQEQRQQRLEATPIIMRYTVERDTQPYTVNRLYDEAVVAYSVSGEVVNSDEAAAAGHSLDRKGGSMTWLFNTLSGRIICSTGGGSVFFGFPGDKSIAQLDAIEELSAFIAESPQGGDITSIIEKYQRNK